MHDPDRPAPGDLALVQQLVNTLDLEEGTDALDGAWPASVGLGSGELPDSGVARVVRFREAVRRVLLSHNGAAVDSDALAELEALGREVPVSVSFSATGAPRLQPAGSGADRVIGR